MRAFLNELSTQRWDDHRYYHQSRINQTLHLVSALSFLTAYVYLIIDPPVAALIGWLFSMVTRQSGHFFFEPKGYDTVNQATFEHKEAIKVGYNLDRKMVLLSVWAGLPLLLYVEPSFFGLLEAHTNGTEMIRNVGWLWLWLGVGAVAFRVLQLTITQSLWTGFVWASKILTDPFHDVTIYWKSPFYLLRGQLLDPMEHVHKA